MSAVGRWHGQRAAGSSPALPGERWKIGAAQARRGRHELQGQWSSAGISGIGLVVASCRCVTPNGINPPLDRSSLAACSRPLAGAFDANYETVLDPQPADHSQAHRESTRPAWA